jgi:hypothetical protein
MTEIKYRMVFFMLPDRFNYRNKWRGRICGGRVGMGPTQTVIPQAFGETEPPELLNVTRENRNIFLAFPL